MIEQIIKGFVTTKGSYEYRVEIKTADELGGFPVCGKNDAAVIEIFDKDGKMVDSGWLVISKNGKMRIERT